MSSNSAKRSASMSRNPPPSRPTTPLRPGSRTSLRDSQGFSAGGSSSEFPLDVLEPGLAELSDSMADLEANFMHLQLMYESLSRFNESFASFLYGLNMNAFCVDFPEVRGVPWLGHRPNHKAGIGACSGVLQTGSAEWGYWYRVGPWKSCRTHAKGGQRFPQSRRNLAKKGRARQLSCQLLWKSKGSDSKYASVLTSLLRTADTSYVSSLPTASSRYTTPGPTSRPSSAFNRRGGGENITGTVRRGSVRGTGRGRRGSGLARARPRGARWKIIFDIFANARFPAGKMPAPYEFSGKLDRVCKAAKISHGTPRPYHPVALLVGEDILYVKFASGWLASVLEAAVKSQDFHLRACQWIIEEVHENIPFALV